ncbi:PPOX class F420-dependent oxidoreductase [Actinobacteria bacterium YIM 96077]|uniref:PPOX class F420-dependent oxidoreductase n=1 Tax=Phytoactinopolyspora halophila TaxID=1981511 RepID=A0A329QHM5_9ACTN|nr:PPOX class F420-dependent oxidoreductase [Phytoactinopolyspora halophila]AYY15655.1 PPOX class F420-dependent oxidoreductase [Actinobacteria bacterium YIM 96077]RAW11865.1 PPOX class F420-dependent oxidoreductase [Phytoactinopolyspora halophila]
MPTLTDHARSLFARPILGWVTVIRPDGSPHNSVVWLDVEGDTVLFNTAIGRAKERYLRENPSVSVSVLDPDHAFSWASVSGTATFTTDDGNEVIHRLAHKYTGADFRELAEDERRVTVRVTPEHLVEQSSH